MFPPHDIQRIVFVLLAALASGCVQQMANQPRVDTYEPPAFFADGLSVRPPVAGTIARGQLVADTAVMTGRVGDAPVEEIAIDVTDDVLKRGQQQFGIFCAPCHGAAGYGDGMVVQRGFPAPPSYHIERLRTAPAGQLFRVITDGFRRMPSFGRRISPEDRWAIVAYVRALQLSQDAPVEELSAADQKALSGVEESSTP